MLGQLRPESPLDQGLLQLLEEALLSEQIFRFRIARKQLLQKLRRNRRFGRHASLLQKVNSQKPAYTILKTPSRDAPLAPVIRDAEPQELALLWPRHRALRRVDLQPQLIGQEPAH